MRKLLVTAALPYANGPLHFGHIAGAYLPADCYVRFQRLQKNEVLFLCGSDEYGIAITLSAELAGRTPQQQVDLFHKINADFFKTLNIQFDHFARTTWPGHIPTVHQYFLDLLNNGFIEERETHQLYSEQDGRFLADRYVEGICPKCGYEPARGDECPRCGASYEATDLLKPRSKLTKAPLALKATRHWFLLLDKFKDRLTEFLATRQHWKPNVRSFAENYVKELHPRAITRDLDWGVPVPLPNAQGKVLYVWFDAPIGYISAAKEWAQLSGQPDRWKEYWYKEDGAELVNFIGKDNIPFHAIIFPAMTMGQDQPYKLVDHLPANEFYMLEGRQFSKSDGHTIHLDWFFEYFSHKTHFIDQIRYLLAANAPETADSSFTWLDFHNRCSGELVGKYGNFAHRVLTFVQSKCEGRIPAPHAFQEYDSEFLAKASVITDQTAAAYDAFKLRQAAQHIMELAQLGNAYFDAKAPWKAAKDPAMRPEMETTIACCLSCLHQLALISYPIMPEAAKALWELLGHTKPLIKSWDTKPPIILHSTSLPTPQTLFHRIDYSIDPLKYSAVETYLGQKKDLQEFKRTDLWYEYKTSATAEEKREWFQIITVKQDTLLQKSIQDEDVKEGYKLAVEKFGEGTLIVASEDSSGKERIEQMKKFLQKALLQNFHTVYRFSWLTYSSGEDNDPGGLQLIYQRESDSNV